MNWQDNLVYDSERVRELLVDTKTIAVLGIKTEVQAGQPAFYVPKYMQSAGFKIIPVPVYFPDATQILGEKVYRQLADIPVEVDMVNVFRRPQDIPPHLEDIIELSKQIKKNSDRFGKDAPQRKKGNSS